MRSLILTFWLGLALYAVVVPAVLIAKGHAARGTLGISLGAR